MNYVLSDIHGNRQRFDSIMEQIALQPEDTLYVLGDVIDRYPDGIRILRQLMKMPNVKMLLGNHEYMMLDALYYHRDEPADDFAAQYQQERRLALWYRNSEAGYYLVVAGRAYTRTVEAIHFWSALHRAGVPVLLRDASFLKERLQGTERVGIVPKGVIPTYCQSYFPGERVESFMNLPEENRAQFAQAACWRRLEPLELL